jgi:hypothetical protein
MMREPNIPTEPKTLTEEELIRKSYYKERGLVEINDFINKQVWGAPGGVVLQAEAFFGTVDLKKMEIPTGLLTEEELADFKIFATRAIKRVLNALANKNPRGWESDKISLRFLFHDVSHVAGAIACGRHKEAGTANSVVPPFFSTELGEDYSKRELLEDELYGVFWSTLHRNNIPHQPVLSTLSKSQTEEEFISRYVRDVMDAALSVNKTHIQANLTLTRPELTGKEREEELSRLLEVAKVYAEQIQAHPPQKIVDMLHYVWEHKDNPRVLADLFFQEVGPYIEQIKKYSEYSNDPVEEIKKRRKPFEKKSPGNNIEEQPLYH